MQTTIIPNSSDSHFHILEMKRKEIDVAAHLAAARDGGMRWLIDIGTGPLAWDERRSMATHHPGLRFAVGLYPSWAGESWAGPLTELEAQASDPSVVAWGEIGLDFHWDYGSRESQEELVRAQAEAAARLDLPLIIHSRDSLEETAALLEDLKHPRGGIIHCYSGDADALPRFLDLGFFISFAGNVTYKNAASLREALRSVPQDRLLLETDAPYLAPQAIRGKLNSPLSLGHTYLAVAAQLGLAAEELAEIVTRNLANLLNLQES